MCSFVLVYLLPVIKAPPWVKRKGRDSLYQVVAVIWTSHFLCWPVKLAWLKWSADLLEISPAVSRVWHSSEHTSYHEARGLWGEKVPWAERDMQVKRVLKKRGQGAEGRWGRWKKARAGGDTDTTEGREEEEEMFSVLAETDSNSLLGTHTTRDVATFVCKGIDDGVGAHSERSLPFEMHNWGCNFVGAL